MDKLNIEALAKRLNEKYKNPYFKIELCETHLYFKNLKDHTIDWQYQAPKGDFAWILAEKIASGDLDYKVKLEIEKQQELDKVNAVKNAKQSLINDFRHFGYIHLNQEQLLSLMSGSVKSTMVRYANHQKEKYGNDSVFSASVYSTNHKVDKVKLYCGENSVTVAKTMYFGGSSGKPAWGVESGGLAGARAGIGIQCAEVLDQVLSVKNFEKKKEIIER